MIIIHNEKNKFKVSTRKARNGRELNTSLRLTAKLNTLKNIKSVMSIYGSKKVIVYDLSKQVPEVLLVTPTGKPKVLVNAVIPEKILKKYHNGKA